GVALRPDDAFLRPPPPAPAPQFSCGRDRYGEVTPDDFFDPRWVPGDECPGSGVHALAELADVAMVAAPDLYSPFPLVAPQAVHDAPTFAGATFQTCVEAEIPPAAPPAVGTCPDGLPADAPGSQELDGLRLDPTLPDERERIVGYQQRLVALADLLERWQVLLSVPPGLNHRQVLDWRTRFGSAYAAAYHPWLVVSRGKATGEVPVRIPPCGVAAGIVARQELAFGIPHGPANVLAAGALAVADAVSPARHDELHPQGINVFLRERDGIRLSAARTLSRDPAWRQMSVRRLVTMLRRVLERQMQWAVFEPNNTSLREEVKRVLDVYLRQLYRANAFKGKTEREAFFVRCDEALNPPQVVDAGALIAHVGVAPAEPLEFILVRIARGGDGTLRLEG
ncbi:MAG TPA: phage tail sheath C-terminal domain-containing protein, partial [Longimicrobiaceae bacterium]|nr:phage tail sheath C-terminal domain-containing protein [Longimicrobiaceae bacterium]